MGREGRRENGRAEPFQPTGLPSLLLATTSLRNSQRTRVLLRGIMHGPSSTAPCHLFCSKTGREKTHQKQQVAERAERTGQVRSWWVRVGLEGAKQDSPGCAGSAQEGLCSQNPQLLSSCSLGVGVGGWRCCQGPQDPSVVLGG